MPSIYRISRQGQEPIVDVGSVEAIEGMIQAGNPGPFHIDEISSDRLPSGHTSRRWRTGAKNRDGTTIIEPDPWPAG
jgi:hypothetical protein